FHEQAAQVLEDGKQAEAALPYRERLRSRTPSDGANSVKMARLFLQLGKKSEALELARSVLFGAGQLASAREDALDTFAACVGPAAAGAETAACLELAKKGAPAPWPARAAARLALVGGDTAGYLRQLQELAAKSSQPAAIERELGLYLLKAKRPADAAPVLLSWWRETGEADAALALFSALAAAKKTEAALACRTAPGCPDFDPYEDARTVSETPDLSAVSAELSKVKGAIYAEPASYAEEAAGCFEALEHWGRAASLLRSGAEAVRDDAVRARLLERAAKAEREGAARAAREAGRLTITEGIQN
ncbi:MAG: hypothetical protein HY303_21635, partial [Candidatus Wallbacteria bacterium]|nr:hypothetical protein [Candidatus Wallbacteria bacterium]